MTENCGPSDQVADSGAVSGAGPGAGPAPGEVLRVTRSLSIPMSELSWRFSRSSGPGGQHANKASTRSEVRFDITSSRSLGPRQRARLLERFGPELRVAAEDERSQSRNRSLALERLAGLLASALKTTTPRVATAPSKASRRRRVDEKRKRGEIKRQRGRPRDDD